MGTPPITTGKYIWGRGVGWQKFIRSRVKRKTTGGRGDKNRPD